MYMELRLNVQLNGTILRFGDGKNGTDVGKEFQK